LNHEPNYSIVRSFFYFRYIFFSGFYYLIEIITFYCTFGMICLKI
jgi:hypothetical protein